MRAHGRDLLLWRELQAGHGGRDLLLWGELQARLGELKAAALCSAVVAAPMAKKTKRNGIWFWGMRRA